MFLLEKRCNFSVSVFVLKQKSVRSLPLSQFKKEGFRKCGAYGNVKKINLLLL